MEDSGAAAELAQAREEIERLTQRLADEHFSRELRDALTLTSTAGTIGSPATKSRLLEMIVQTASHVIPARAAALLLIRQETQQLVFEVALGHKAEEARKFTVPLGRGIAGLVAVTGQPMAISEVARDPRHAPEIGRSIGYTPDTILCVPLVYDGRIIGVLEFLDRLGAASFSPADMELLGLFANQAAVAVEQMRMRDNLLALVDEVMGSLGGTGVERRDLAAHAPGFASRVSADPAYQRALDLARLVQEVVWQGEQEATTCHTLLQAFASYLKTRAAAMGQHTGGW